MKKKYVRAGQLFLNGNEALVAQLQSLEDTGILEQTVPGTEALWDKSGNSECRRWPEYPRKFPEERYPDPAWTGKLP